MERLLLPFPKIAVHHHPYQSLEGMMLVRIAGGHDHTTAVFTSFEPQIGKY